MPILSIVSEVIKRIIGERNEQQENEMNPKLFCSRWIFLSDLDGQSLVDAVRNALNSTGAHIVKETNHTFQPFGTTAVFILEESSCQVHSWPEYQKIAISLETCAADFSHQQFQEYLCKELNCFTIHRIALSEVFE